ncbi:cilia- and flagella-associated protein 58-like, partial [Nilaparvata lugens]|uniref:cilia- and flagella-associated protein 58-like n=1 Tax=Nilaparvata lugens TaxID=108931 RepID=UPI00193DD56E
MERVQEGEKGLLIKLDGVEENLRSKILDIADLKKQLSETEAVVKQQQALFETVRTEKNAIAKELFQCKGEIEGLHERTKLMTSQIEQLKGDIANKEDLLTKEELAFRKAQTEKECLRADVQRWRDAVRDSKRAANLLQEEVKDIKHSMKECDFEINRLNVEKKHVMNEKIAISKQLLNASQENDLLNEKVKIFQATIDKGKTLYAKRLHDIRLLKFEIEQLRKEKGNLSKALNNTTDFRSEIYHLERDLAKERLKSKALEEELQTPLNVHRWRKLEGSDPSKLELIQKIHILQKRLVKGISTIEEQEKKYVEVEQKYEVLKLKFCRQPTPQASQQLYKVQLMLRKKIQTIK